MKIRKLDQVDFTLALIILAVIFRIIFVDVSHYFTFFTLSIFIFILNRLQSKSLMNSYFVMGIIFFFQVVIIKHPNFIFDPEIFAEQGTNFLFNFVEMNFLNSLFVRDYSYIPIFQRLSSHFLLTVFGIKNFNISGSLFSLFFTAISFSFINLNVFRSFESNNKLRFFYSLLLSTSILINFWTLIFINFIYSASIPLILFSITRIEKLSKTKLVILTISFSLIILSKSIFVSLLPLYVLGLIKSIRNKEKNKIIFTSSLIASMILLVAVTLTLSLTTDVLILGQNLYTSQIQYNDLNTLEEFLIAIISRFLPFIEDAINYKSRSNLTHLSLFYFIGLVKMSITFIQSFSVFFYLEGMSSFQIHSIVIGMLIFFFLTLSLIVLRKSISINYIELFVALIMVNASNIFITWLAFDYSTLVNNRQHYLTILSSIFIQLFFVRLLFDNFKSRFRLKAIGYFFPLIIVGFLILNSNFNDSFDYEQRNSTYSKWSYFHTKVLDIDYVIPINPEGWFIIKNNPHELIIDSSNDYISLNKISARMIIVHCENSCYGYEYISFIDTLENLYRPEVLLVEDRIYFYFNNERLRLEAIDFAELYPSRIHIIGEMTVTSNS